MPLPSRLRAPRLAPHTALARLTRLVAVVAAAGAALTSVYACSTGNGSVIADDDASTTRRDAATTPDAPAPVPDATSDARADGGAFDPSKVCAQELEYFAACKRPASDINCTAAKFEAWCTTNQAATDSEQRVRARAACLDAKHCDTKSLNDCIYSTYSTLKPSAAQEKLVADYCSTCEPADSTCAARKIAYDPAKGPGSVDDVYLAAWELSEKLTLAIDQKCTGPAIADAGADAGSCQKRFGNCAGSLYVDALPDCPK